MAGGRGPLRKNLEGHWINFLCITFKAGQPEVSYFCCHCLIVIHDLLLLN